MSNDIDNVTPKGVLLVVSGPSGAGKGTICQMLRDQLPDLGYSISVTTRAPRTGEVDGESYFFKTIPEVKQMIEKGELLEYAEFVGNYYGTPEEAITGWLNQGKNVLLEIEVQGAEKVMDFRSDLVSIFITIPSMAELERRLRDRGTETEDKIRGRMEVARRELTRAFRYDYVVLNDEVELAVKRINTIIDAEQMRYARMENYVLEVLEDVETH